MKLATFGVACWAALISSIASGQVNAVTTIDASQAAKCKFVDTVVANARGSDISDMVQKARERAAADTASKGANAMVITEVSSTGSFILISVNAYSCPR